MIRNMDFQTDGPVTVSMRFAEDGSLAYLLIRTKGFEYEYGDRVDEEPDPGDENSSADSEEYERNGTNPVYNPDDLTDEQIAELRAEGVIDKQPCPECLTHERWMRSTSHRGFAAYCGSCLKVLIKHVRADHLTCENNRWVLRVPWLLPTTKELLLQQIPNSTLSH